MAKHQHSKERKIRKRVESFDPLRGAEEAVFEQYTDRMRLAGMQDEDVNRIRQAYEEYVETLGEVRNEKGDGVTLSDVRERIPGNPWVILLLAALGGINGKPLK